MPIEIRTTRQTVPQHQIQLPLHLNLIQSISSQAITRLSNSFSNGMNGLKGCFGVVLVCVCDEKVTCGLAHYPKTSKAILIQVDCDDW